MIDRDEALIRLVKSAWERDIAREAEAILWQAVPEDRERVSFMIANLCGVTVAPGPDFGARLSAVLDAPSGNEAVVVSMGQCANEACRDRKGGSPCAGACPFHAIMIDRKTNSLSIDRSKCVECGLCVDACPDGILEDRVEYIPATKLLQGGRPVIAAVAPAILGQFGEGATIEKLRAAFKKLGYADMVEVAFFADMLTMKEAGEFNEHVLTKDDFLISSCCCPIWVAMLRRVYKDLVKHVSPSVSPMIAAGRALKILRPDCAVVFVGPCVAKKAEVKDADLVGAIDHVFTFVEMKDVFAAAGIDPSALEGEASFEYSSRGGRLYARAGGVSVAVADAVAELYPVKSKFLTVATADGVPACKELLVRVGEGKANAGFIEGMGCVGGCVGGPKAIIPREEGKRLVDAFGEGAAIPVATKSDCMKEILGKLGIFGPDAFIHGGKGKIFEREF
ncbi:MAG: [Fe-Fe] hydrogenase large subunit C-terminal domain-containing protein [Treponemataceae bacterium]